MTHPILVPKGFHDQVAVRWLTHCDGRCHARDFADAHPDCKASLAARMKYFAQWGRIGSVPEHGHKMNGEYDGLWLFHVKRRYRFLAFRHGADLFLTNAGLKKPGKFGNEPEYRFALSIMVGYFDSLKQGTENSGDGN